MRLPLGVLSGMGFIGAGAIVRRDNFVVGVTTAATLWFVTITGLCFGSGHITLGLVGAAIGMAALAGLKLLEDRMHHDRQVTLFMLVDQSGPDEKQLCDDLTKAGLKPASCAVTYNSESKTRELTCDLRWRAAGDEPTVPEVVQTLAGRSGVLRIAWTPKTP